MGVARSQLVVSQTSRRCLHHLRSGGRRCPSVLRPRHASLPGSRRRCAGHDSGGHSRGRRRRGDRRRWHRVDPYGGRRPVSGCTTPLLVRSIRMSDTVPSESGRARSESTVVVGVDGSDHSLRALEWAAHYSLAMHCRSSSSRPGRFRTSLHRSILTSAYLGRTSCWNKHGQSSTSSSRHICLRLTRAGDSESRPRTAGRGVVGRNNRERPPRDRSLRPRRLGQMAVRVGQ